MAQICVYCSHCGSCPIGGKPIEPLKVGLVKIERYSCEELVSLYLKFVEIGKIVKEEKNVSSN